MLNVNFPWGPEGGKGAAGQRRIQPEVPAVSVPEAGAAPAPDVDAVVAPTGQDGQ